MKRNLFRIFLFLLFLIFLFQCKKEVQKNQKLDTLKFTSNSALVTTKFKSFEELKSILEIEYSKDRKSWVQLTQKNTTQKMQSILKSGVSESDFITARDGNFWNKISLGLRSPFFVANRKDLHRVFILSRRKQKQFGEGDIAFYDLAESMLHNINEIDFASMTAEDQSDKGYLNTFNHINAQAIMTTLFSEELADFVADTHERRNMPELITGKFTVEQLADIKNGPVDNYVDIINNEWGQELGKMLKWKYKIDRETIWTPELLANYLNDLQSYYSWNFQMGFKPFKAEDQLVTRFSFKIKSLMESLSAFE